MAKKVVEKMKETGSDELNNKRVEDTKLRVAHAIKLISAPIECLCNDHTATNACQNIAHALGLLESASQDMKWACEHFNWNDDICYQLNDACAKLGNSLAILIDDKANDYDPEMAGCIGQDALAILGKAIGTLYSWFDETKDCSEV